MSTPKETLLISAREFFEDSVTQAFERVGVETFPLAKNYMVDLLTQFLNRETLFPADDQTEKPQSRTMAERWFEAVGAEPALRPEKLRRLADSTLYISGFFGDSLKRKLVDVDYYAEIGGSAYAHLAHSAEEDMMARLYSEYAQRFLEFVDVLTYLSQKSLVQSNGDLLRLYERYVTTGSTLARDQLVEKGLLTPADLVKAKAKQ